jgi:DNA-binding transcriptional ArsR family regulator
VSSVCTLSRYAAGGEIPQDTFEQIAMDLGASLDRAAEARRVIDYCRAKGAADPRRAPTTGTIPSTGPDVITELIAWRDEAMGSDTIRRSSTGGSLAKIIDAIFVDAIATAARSRRRRVSGAWDVRMSTRQLAEAAGLSRRTVMRLLPAIAQHVRIHTTPTGTIWRVPFPSARATEPSRKLSPPPKGEEGPPYGSGDRLRLEPSPGLPSHATAVSLPSSNAWHQAGNAYRVWSALDLDDVFTAEMVATVLGLHRATVYRHLSRLAADGLAVRTIDGWLRVDGTEPPSFDWAADRRARHNAERVVYRAVTRRDELGTDEESRQ